MEIKAKISPIHNDQKIIPPKKTGKMKKALNKISLPGRNFKNLMTKRIINSNITKEVKNSQKEAGFKGIFWISISGI